MNYLVETEGKDTSFITPKGRRAYEAFQGLFSHTDGKIRDGYGEDGCGRGVVGTERLILITLSMIRDHDMMKKSHTWNRG
jgi:hypothetical protein